MVAVIPSDVAAVMRAGGYQSRFYADAYYNGLPTLSTMPVLATGRVSGSASSQIQTTADVTIESDVVSMSGSGLSIAPASAVDALATFGQEIILSQQILFGQTVVGVIGLGRFRISEAPSIVERGRRMGNGFLITSASVELTLDDRFEALNAAQFPTLMTPLPSATMWGEVRRLSPFPVVVSPYVPDVPVASTMVYDRNRLTTITSLFAVANAEPAFTRDGALTARPIDPTSAGIATIDVSGRVQPFARTMSGDFTNHIVVTATINGTAQTIAQAMVTDGPLRYNGPVGDRVEVQDAGLATDAVAAQNLASSLLAQRMSSRANQIKVSCLPDLTIELGDPIRATDPDTGVVVTGTVADYTRSLDPTDLMDLTIQQKVYS